MTGADSEWNEEAFADFAVYARQILAPYQPGDYTLRDLFNRARSYVQPKPGLLAERHRRVLASVREIGTDRYVSVQEVASHLKRVGLWEDLFGGVGSKRIVLMAVLRDLHKAGYLDRDTRPSYGSPEPIYRAKKA